MSSLRHFARGVDSLRKSPRDLGDELPRERQLGHARQRMRAGVVEQRDLVVVAAKGILRPIGDHQRHFLAARFSSALREMSSVSAAKPTQYGAFGRAATVARMSTVGCSVMVSGAPLFLSFVAAGDRV